MRSGAHSTSNYGGVHRRAGSGDLADERSIDSKVKLQVQNCLEAGAARKHSVQRSRAIARGGHALRQAYIVERKGVAAGKNLGTRRDADGHDQPFAKLHEAEFDIE